MSARTVLVFSPGAAGPLLRDDLAWQEKGECQYTDPDLFFPEVGVNAANARKVCFSCAVRGECLEFALENAEEWGVWGGLTYPERVPLLRDRRGQWEAERDARRAVLDERAAEQHPDGDKQCRRCGETRPLAAFSYLQSAADGLDRYCRDCCRDLKTAALAA